MATGTRELDVLSARHLVDKVNAIVLTGGSAFGLAAADGVMEWLEEGGEGFDTGIAKVPLVPAAVIFDLAPGVARPGREEGMRAAIHASREPVPEGRVGAGAGATVGKILGPEASSAGGVGSAARKWKGGTVGVLAVVNALGDVVAEDGSVLAGARAPHGDYPGSDGIVLDGLPSPGIMPGTNTTLGVVATDLSLGRVDLAKLAEMASAAFPRAISPVNTPFDGDLVFALSTADDDKVLPPEEMLALGIVARTLTEEAIRRAVGFEDPGS
jgi:L-aminopeptidase/D-esterase-like protein